MCLNMDILPMDGDFPYEMEFHEMMSLNHFCKSNVRTFIGLIKQVGHNKLVFKHLGVHFERQEEIYSTAKETRKFGYS